MKTSNSFKISIFSLKLFESKRPFLHLTQILSAKHFSPIKINTHKKAKLKAILETSTFQIPEMEIFKSNGSFCKFYPNLPKTFFILKISKQPPFKYPKCKLSNLVDSGAFVKTITGKFLF